MKITRNWLTKNDACANGREWWKQSGLTDHAEIALRLLKKKHYDWANWMLVRLMGHKDIVRYAIRGGNHVLPIFEKEYPEDKRPRIALETTERWINDEATKEECRAAADAADAAYAAYAADAAYAAAYAAYAAAYATAYATAYAAADAAYAAADAAAARHKFWAGQIKYGLKLIAEAK